MDVARTANPRAAPIAAGAGPARARFQGPAPATGRPSEPRTPPYDVDLRPAPTLDDGSARPPETAAFEALRAAYQSSGGLAFGDELARLLEGRRCGGFVSLARLVVSAEVFGFEAGQAFWVPMFQFDAQDLTVRPESRRVLAELVPAYDGWALATWFVQANAWLDARRPLAVLFTDPSSVLEAARADRFVATG
jgi:hypothetical protein